MTYNFSPTRLIAALVIVAGVVTMGSSDLQAQDNADDAEARTLFAEGQRHYEAGGYEKSVELFTKAYELSKKPLLLFNIANAEERLGNYEKAIAALQDYVDSPAATDKEAVRERIARLERRSAEKKATRERERERERELAEAKAAAAGTGGGPINSTSPIDEPVDDRPSAVPGWALVGVGGALIVGGAISGVFARSASGDAEDQCNPMGVCPTDAKSDIDRANRLALISDLSIATGIVAAGVGGYLLFRRGSKSGSESKTVQLDVGPSTDGFYAGLSGSF